MANFVQSVRVSSMLKDLIDVRFVSWRKLCNAVLGTQGLATPFRRRCVVRVLSDLTNPDVSLAGYRLRSVSRDGNGVPEYVLVEFNGRRYWMKNVESDK